MTAVLLTPLTGQFFDNNGEPLSGGLIYSYVSGTTTPQATYTDYTGTIPASNPIVLDSAGRADVWGSGVYSFEVKDSLGNTIDTLDGVTAIYGAGDMTKAIYDAANISQQVVGTTAVQTVTNKTLSNAASLSFVGTAGIIGTTTNNNADAGSVGEVLSAVNVSGTALTTGTPVTITSVSLTAGDWDISGQVVFQPAATTSITRLQGGTNNTTNVLPGTLDVSNAIFQQTFSAFVPNATFTYPLNTVRKSLASTTTIYLVAQANFTVSTINSFGYIRARRVR